MYPEGLSCQWGLDALVYSLQFEMNLVGSLLLSCEHAGRQQVWFMGQLTYNQQQLLYG